VRLLSSYFVARAIASPAVWCGFFGRRILIRRHTIFPVFTIAYTGCFIRPAGLTSLRALFVPPFFRPTLSTRSAHLGHHRRNRHSGRNVVTTLRAIAVFQDDSWYGIISGCIGRRKSWNGFFYLVMVRCVSAQSRHRIGPSWRTDSGPAYLRRFAWPSACAPAPAGTLWARSRSSSSLFQIPSFNCYRLAPLLFGVGLQWIALHMLSMSFYRPSRRRRLSLIFVYISLVRRFF